MVKMKTVMVGVANFGAYRRTIMREIGLFEIIAAYDINPSALEECVNTEGAMPVQSYDELLAIPEAEAMIISTGAKFHAEQVIKAADMGLHVFVEKPLCSTIEELQMIFAARKNNNVVIGVGHSDHRHSTVSALIRKKIAAGELGKIAAFEKTTCHSGGLMIKPGDWRGDPDKNPGGMLFQCGVHAFHELRFYFGDIESVSAQMRDDVHTTGTADVALCHVTFESGVTGALNAYHVCPYRHTFSIFGTKRNLYEFNYFFDKGVKLYQQTDHYDNREQPLEEVLLPPIKGKDDHGTNLVSFYEAIKQGKTAELYPSLEDGAQAVLAVFAADKSAREGRPVRLDEFAVCP